MSASVRYGASSVALISLLTLGLWPFLDAAGRMGVLVAAAVAIPIQVAAFVVLVRYRGEVKGFMAAWAGGMAIRAAALLAVAILVIRSGSASAIPMLLALAGFFFALLLLEPVCFKADPPGHGKAA
ncbi:MAG TPA: hypothetical protein VM198_04485 [Longimicrobiales bacterium]|nr:hypothetical protein [Longimicrobiales bacterium]